MFNPSMMPAHRPKVEVEQERKAPVVKKPFVPKPHLTQRPLKNHPGLQQLRTKSGGRR